MCKEIDNVVVFGWFLLLDDKFKFLFCEVVCYEVLWIVNVVLIIGLYVLKDDVMMNGYVILKNVIFFIDLDLINMDFDLFFDLFKFNLDCFMLEDGVVIGMEKIGLFLIGEKFKEILVFIFCFY